MVYKVFIDTNVFLDAYLERTENWKDAEDLLQLGARRLLTIYTSANNLINTIYVLQKQKLSTSDIIHLIELTLTFTELVNTSNAAFLKALAAGFSDLEDAIQYHTALQINGIDYFITSNTKDFKQATHSLPVVTPKKFLSAYNNKRNPQ